MKTNESLRTALDYFNAWRSKHFEDARKFLADDAAFDMPINTYQNTDQFMDAVMFTARTATRVDLIAQFENNDEALLLYEMESPSIGLLTIAEHFKINNGKITLVRHVHDTYGFRAAGLGAKE